jgi:hypothetical protein
LPDPCDTWANPLPAEVHEISLDVWTPHPLPEEVADMLNRRYAEHLRARRLVSVQAPHLHVAKPDSRRLVLVTVHGLARKEGE